MHMRKNSRESEEEKNEVQIAINFYQKKKDSKRRATLFALTSRKVIKSDSQAWLISIKLDICQMVEAKLFTKTEKQLVRKTLNQTLRQQAK